MSLYDLGFYCHWCGAFLGHGNMPKTGHHRFCPDTPCKMAHHRAFKFWQEHFVTRSSGLELPAGDSPGPKRNKIEGRRRPAKPGRSPASRPAKSNRRKGSE